MSIIGFYYGTEFRVLIVSGSDRIADESDRSSWISLKLLSLIVLGPASWHLNDILVFLGQKRLDVPYGYLESHTKMELFDRMHRLFHEQGKVMTREKVCEHCEGKKFVDIFCLDISSKSYVETQVGDKLVLAPILSKPFLCADDFPDEDTDEEDEDTDVEKDTNEEDEY